MCVGELHAAREASEGRLRDAHAEHTAAAAAAHAAALGEAAAFEAKAVAHFKKAMVSLLMSGSARRLHQALRKWITVAHTEHIRLVRQSYELESPRLGI